MGTLYIVGTPIGNLEDITLRAVRVLGQVDLIAAEDTRVSRKLLSHLDIHVPLTSYHQHNWQAKLPSLLDALASSDVALVTDAGMPGISDPGSELVSRAAGAGFPVEVIPGVSAVTTALAASGLPGDSFLFLGFMPRRGNERRAQLESIAALLHTLVIFEAPHRLKVTLQEMLKVLGDREISVCRELTKLHEEVFRGLISQALDYFKAPRGEFVLIVAGAADKGSEPGGAQPDLSKIKSQLQELRKSGTRAKEAVALVADASGLPKNRVYDLWLKTRDQT
jgi:16S rRNA (cytidine1402-2'-O)-methyltransferase